MAERKSLVESLQANQGVDPQLLEEFVYERPRKKGSSAVASDPPPPAPDRREGKGASAVSRVGLTTRIRTDYGEALKRASLERQLAKVTPNTLQDILEDALGPWLRSNGYIQ